MLVLSRKVSEKISIGDNIQIKITHLSSGRVQVGIEAPRSVSIQRSELLQPADDVVPVGLQSLNGRVVVALPR